MSGNPFFALEPVPPDLVGWLPLTELMRPGAVLADRVGQARAALGTDQQRVAASVDLLGVAARVLSPALRVAAVEDRVPCLDVRAIWWRPARPGPMRLAADVRAWAPARPEAFVAHAVTPVAQPLVAAYGAAFAVSRRLLWGNVAAALTGAADGLPGTGAAELVAGALRLGPLAGTVRAGLRRSCCLYYRVPGGGRCADCVLRARAGGRPVGPVGPVGPVSS